MSEAQQMLYRKQKRLLDAIDDMSCPGLENLIELPRIVVCGGQSSGKSSTLESISGLDFPTGDLLCTRFVTRLVMRRHPDTTLTASIIPSADRTLEERHKLEAFTAPVHHWKQFEKIVEAAGQLMGTDEDKSFKRDILEVRVTGPTIPFLTLIDLPGLVHNSCELQTEQDVDFIHKLVQNYMEQSRTIILAVVSARVDLAGQVVLKYVKAKDPSGKRTLGIITKPDSLDSQGQRRQFLELAQNKNSRFKFDLGWHVLKNRSDAERGCSIKDRDASEATFLASGIWAELPESDKGSASLRTRLGNTVYHFFMGSLPAVKDEIQQKIKAEKAKLAELGSTECDMQQAKDILILAMARYNEVFQKAIRSDSGPLYTPYSSEPPIDLYGDIDELVKQFFTSIERYGHRYDVGETRKDRLLNQTSTLTRHTLLPPLGQAPEQLPYAKLIERSYELTKLALRIPGKFNAVVPSQLFYEQSTAWPKIVQTHISNVFEATERCLTVVTELTVPKDLRAGMLQVIVQPALRKFRMKLQDLVSTKLPDHTMHPVLDFSRSTLQCIRTAQQDEWRRTVLNRVAGFFKADLDATGNLPAEASRSFVRVDLDGLVHALTVDIDFDSFNAAEAIACMHHHYQVYEVTESAEDFMLISSVGNFTTP